jgi:hypothetical protein
MAVDKGKKAKRTPYGKKAARLQAEAVQSTLELVQVVRLDVLHSLLAEIQTEKSAAISANRLRELIEEATVAKDNVMEVPSGDSATG